jgi:methionyl-tRNA formyltransferase
MPKKIVLLCSECFSTTTLYNYISTYFPIEHIVTEEPLRGLALAKRRLKRIGVVTVAGQVAFSVLIVPFLKMVSKKRIAEIKAKHLFDETILPTEKITHFPSINNEACVTFLENLKPDIILVNGTRILSANILNRVPAVFINMHAGITPTYRGVHGGYWALAQNDKENCGVTVHLIDKGIDTGGILFQSKIETNSQDNFVTYPYLQFGEGFPLIKKAIEDIELNKLQPIVKSAAASKLWYHPTIWKYIYLRLFKGIK